MQGKSVVRLLRSKRAQALPRLGRGVTFHTAAPLSQQAAASPAFGLYPGDKKIRYVTEIDTHPPSDDIDKLMPIYRCMDEDGNFRPGAKPPQISQEECLKAYRTMIRLQTMDSVFYESQRQGRISFYMTNWGEESIHMGSAMAWRADDEIFAQYREAGVLMWRGFTLQQFADQCLSNKDDAGKGRQMPVHYGSAALHFQTISSPLATQLPQAAGAAYACKVEALQIADPAERVAKQKVTICYFGEGAASEGDAHAAFNMAATTEAPVIFFCRNNGYAISTRVTEQYRGDGIAARGLAYGIHTIRVDGGDLFAVHHASLLARQIASGQDGTGKTKPVLIEAMAYREGHHSTSDDSTRYRDPAEIAEWRERANPVKRFRKYLEKQGWWDAQKEAATTAEERKAVLQAIGAAEKKEKPGLEELFTDVYGDAALPANLAEQYAALKEHVDKHPQHYNLNAH